MDLDKTYKYGIGFLNYPTCRSTSWIFRKTSVFVQFKETVIQPVESSSGMRYNLGWLNVGFS